MRKRIHTGAQRARARERARLWKLNNPERALANRLMYAERYADKVKVSQRKANLRRKYGITLEDKQQLYTNQQGLCAICHQPIEFNKMHMDHDHVTNQLRDLLCAPCNHGLGQFKDSPERLLAAIAYLARHNAAQAA